MADTNLEKLRHYRYVLSAIDELLRAGQHLRTANDQRFELAFKRAREVLESAQRLDPESLRPKLSTVDWSQLTTVDWHMVAGDALQIGDLDRAIEIINANHKDLYALSVDDLRGCYIALDQAMNRAEDVEAIERIEMGIDKWRRLRLKVGELLAKAEGAIPKPQT